MSLPKLGGKKIKDERIGFEISAPSGFEEVPLQTDEAFIVASYLSKKKYSWRDKDSGYTYSHAPSFKAIVFLDKKFLEVEDEIEIEGGNITIHWESPYTDYESYLAGTYRAGFFVEEDEVSEGKFGEVRKLLVDASGFQAPMKLMTWVYDIEIGKVALQVECLADSVDKVKRLADRSFKTLKPIPRTEDLDSRPSGGRRVSFLAMYDLSPEERKVHRQEMEKQSWEKAKASIPDGWDAKEIRGINVLIGSDYKHAKEVVAHINGVFGWLDKEFHIVGEGEYVSKPIVRICSSYDEFRAYYDASSYDSSGEIVTFKENAGVTGGSWERVNRAALVHWMRERDRTAWSAMPPWLSIGLSFLVDSARPKGKSVDFAEGDFERFFIRRAKQGEISTIADLMKLSTENFEGSDSEFFGEAMALVRFFVDGPGAKDKSARSILPNYLMNLGDVVREMRQKDAEAEEEEGDEPETEEEEQEKRRQDEEKWKARNQEVRDEVFRRTFEGWDDRRWSALEALYRRSF